MIRRHDFWVEEVRLKLAAPMQACRCPRVIAAVLLAAIASGADASTTCLHVEHLPPVLDSQVKARIGDRLQKMPAMRSHEVRQFGNGFAIAWQVDDACKKSFQCFHMLLDIRNDSTTIVFAYQGTGAIWKWDTERGLGSDSLQDRYTLQAFETEDTNWVDVKTPHRLGPVWIGARPAGDRQLRPCAYRTYR